MSALEIIAIIYATSVSLFLINGSAVLMTGRNAYEHKLGATQILTAPIAPLVLTIWAIRGIRKLWKTADFGDKEQR